MIILTAPHAFCIEKFERHCDRLAKKAAITISNTLSKNSLSSYLFLPNTLRSDCDLNRDICINNIYRKNIRKFLKENTNKILFTLDIHSFPKENTKWGMYDLVILDDDGFTDYSISLYKFCKEKGIKISLIAGKGNSIQDEMRFLGYKNLLLEFKESLENSEIITITDIICKWLKNYVK